MSQPYRPGPQYPYPPQGYGPPPVPPRKPRRWPWVVGSLFGLFFLMVGCSAILASANGGRPAARTTTAPTAVAKAPAATYAPVAPAPAPTPVGPASSFKDGVYEVGVDIKTGRYKTTGPGSTDIWDSCYVEVSKDDSGELRSIRMNDNLTGPGVVTVKKGEFFKVSGGCTWSLS